MQASQNRFADHRDEQSGARHLQSWGRSAMSFYSYITGAFCIYFAALLLTDLYIGDHARLLSIVMVQLGLLSIVIAFVSLVMRRPLPLWVGCLLAVSYSFMALSSLLQHGWSSTITGSLIQVLPLVAMFVGAFFSAKYSRPAVYAHVLICALIIVLTGHSDLLSIPRAFSIIFSIIFSLEIGVYGRRRAQTETLYDALTGALNRRGLEHHLGHEIQRAQRYHHPLSLVLIDFNGFKQLNDREGHSAGDRALQAAVKTWRQLLRTQDVIGRLGGDEFVIVFPETGTKEVRTIMNRLSDEADLSWSWGLSQMGRYDTVETMLARADKCMYVDKERSR